MAKNTPAGPGKKRTRMLLREMEAEAAFAGGDCTIRDGDGKELLKIAPDVIVPGKKVRILADEEKPLTISVRDQRGGKPLIHELNLPKDPAVTQMMYAFALGMGRELSAKCEVINPYEFELTFFHYPAPELDVLKTQTKRGR